MSKDEITKFGNDLRKKISGLPKPRYWSKHGLTRLYFNAKDQKNRDRSFFIDFTTVIPVLKSYNEEYWINKGLPAKATLAKIMHETRQLEFTIVRTPVTSTAPARTMIMDEEIDPEEYKREKTRRMRELREMERDR